MSRPPAEYGVDKPDTLKPALLTDNGSGYISNLMQEFLRAHGLKHVRARGHHPQTIGKIERRHRTMKDEVELVVHMSPDQLGRAIGQFVEYYNRERYHEVYLPLAWRWETSPRMMSISAAGKRSWRGEKRCRFGPSWPRALHARRVKHIRAI